MAPRGAVAHARFARELAQRERLCAALAHRALGPLEQGGPEVAVVVAALGHRRGIVAAQVVVDNIVVSAYIVVHDHVDHRADLPDLQDRTAIVTGANSGIGRAAASALAGAGARVVLAVRDAAKGRAAAAAMPGAAEVRVLDLADLASVRAFAAAGTARSTC